MKAVGLWCWLVVVFSK